MSATNIELRENAIKLLQKYSLANMIESYDVNKINELVKLHKDKLASCTTFQKAKLLADEMIATATGYPVSINMFISNEHDLRALYDILIKWRDSIAQ